MARTTSASASSSIERVSRPCLPVVAARMSSAAASYVGLRQLARLGHALVAQDLGAELGAGAHLLAGGVEEVGEPQHPVVLVREVGGLHRGGRHLDLFGHGDTSAIRGARARCEVAGVDGADPDERGVAGAAGGSPGRATRRRAAARTARPTTLGDAAVDVRDQGAQAAAGLAAERLEETGDVGVGHRPVALDDRAGVVVGEHRHQVAAAAVQRLAGGVEQLERDVDLAGHAAGPHRQVAGERRDAGHLVGPLGGRQPGELEHDAVGGRESGDAEVALAVPRLHLDALDDDVEVDGDGRGGEQADGAREPRRRAARRRAGGGARGSRPARGGRRARRRTPLPRRCRASRRGGPREALVVVGAAISKGSGAPPAFSAASRSSGRVIGSRRGSPSRVLAGGAGGAPRSTVTIRGPGARR